MKIRPDRLPDVPDIGPTPLSEVIDTMLKFGGIPDDIREEIALQEMERTADGQSNPVSIKG